MVSLTEFREIDYLPYLQALSQNEYHACPMQPAYDQILTVIQEKALTAILGPFGPRMHFLKTNEALDRAVAS
jgi:hypothetical protein